VSPGLHKLTTYTFHILVLECWSWDQALLFHKLTYKCLILCCWQFSVLYFFKKVFVRDCSLNTLDSIIVFLNFWEFFDWYWASLDSECFLWSSELSLESILVDAFYLVLCEYVLALASEQVWS
jgi:hypothetical protein